MSNAPRNVSFVKAFWGLYLRDLRVLSRELMPFVLRVGMQPLLFLFVFTFIMPRMSGGNPMMSGMQAGAGGAADRVEETGRVFAPALLAIKMVPV